MLETLRNLNRGLAIGLILGLVFVAGVGTGVVVTRGTGGLAGSDPNLRDFVAAYNLVTQRSYYRPFDKHHLIYAAIDGMLSATGDPHTVFLAPSDSQTASQELNGTRFSGIGAIVQPLHGDLQILVPLPHTPASDAGLKAGDLVTRIDGRPTSTMTGDAAIARIHGPAGSLVHLTVIRGHGRPFMLAVRRAQIPPITAYGRMLGHHLGYLRILSFGDDTSREVAEALSSLSAQGANALIVDLRENPGGYVDAAQKVVSQFVRRGPVAYEEDTHKHLVALPLVRGEHVVSLPMAVLVDAGTASAAEITAGALHDMHRAVLIGTRTYGKGSMQSVYTLADGSTIRITDRLWLTPDRKSIQGVGIKPDIPVAETVAQLEGNADPQLSVAERYLRHRLP